MPNHFSNVRFTDGSRRVVLGNEMALIDDCIDIIGSVPIGGSLDETFHVDLPTGGGSATLANVLVLRATGVAMAVGAPDAQEPTPGNPPTSPDDFPSVPEFTFFVYDHLGNTRIMYHNDLLDCSQAGVRYVLEHVLDYPYGRTLREYVLDRERFETTYHERDEESGLDYRGARFYDGDIGRFLSCDPLAMKYLAWSTYNYVLGNPVRLVDPDGRAPTDIIVTRSGNNINIKVTGVVFNESSTKYTREQLQQYADRISAGIKESYSGESGNITFSASAEIGVAESESDIKSSDHVFRIEDDGKIPDGQGGFEMEGTNGRTDKGHNYIYIAQYVLDMEPANQGESGYYEGKTKYGEGTLERVAAHEVGHSASLPHPSDKNPQPSCNLMYQSGESDAGKQLTEEQILQIEKAYNENELNSGRKKMRNRF